jgi:galactokinase
LRLAWRGVSRAGSVTAFAPGRVNLLGDHADHTGGLALPFAIDRGVTVRATTLPGPLTMARALDLRETDTFDAWRPGEPADVGGWRAILRGTVAELAATGVPVRPARIEVRGTVPRSGGLSSSVALGAALALAIVALAGDEAPDRRALARLCSRVHERWFGAPAGLLDPYAALLAQDGKALRIDFGADAVDPVPLAPRGHVLAVVAAGGRRERPASTGADRRRECAEAARQLGVASLGAADPEAVEALDEPWRSRALHVLGENGRVAEAADALARGDTSGLGALLDASHASLRDCFAASTDGVERTIERCRAGGALAARLMGGGFSRILILLPRGARVPLSGFAVHAAQGAWVR